MSDQSPVQPLPPQDPQPIPPAPLPVLPYAQATSQRPGILQATGIMSIVIGGMSVLLGLCGIARSIMPFVMSRIMANVQVTGPTTLPADPFANLPVAPVVFDALAELASMALAIYLIVCGALVLRDHKNGRQHHLRYATMKFALALPVAVAGAWSAYSMQTTILTSIPQAASAGVPPMLLGVAAAQAGFWLIVSLAYPVAVVIVMRLAHVRGYCAYLAEMPVIDRFPAHQ